MRKIFRVFPGLIALLVCGLSLVSAPSVLGQDATPAAECAATSPEDNATTVTRYFEAIDAETDVKAMLADELVTHLPSGEEQTNSADEWVASRVADFPDLHVAVENIVAEGDQVAVLTHWSGTQQDTIEDMDVPATGAAADWVGAAFFRLECGKIAEVWFVADNLGMLQDLGVITPEDLQSDAAQATPAP